GRDLPAPEIEIGEGGSPDDLELVLAFDSGALAGQVKTQDGSAAQAAIIALFPEEKQSPYVIQQSTAAGPDGAFSLTGLPPGAYTVFAFPESDSREWEDPELRRRLQDYGKSVRIGEGKRETLELTLAPVAGL